MLSSLLFLIKTIFHGRHHCFENGLNYKNLFFCDTQQVVVKRGPSNDRCRGPIKIGCLINDDWRVARAGNDRPLTGSKRGSTNGRSAGDANQANPTMFKDDVSRFESGFGNDTYQIVDPNVLVNATATSGLGLYTLP